jgi:hypothetical protein
MSTDSIDDFRFGSFLTLAFGRVELLFLIYGKSISNW